MNKERAKSKRSSCSLPTRDSKFTPEGVGSGGAADTEEVNGSGAGSSFPGSTISHVDLSALDQGSWGSEVIHFKDGISDYGGDLDLRGEKRGFMASKCSKILDGVGGAGAAVKRDPEDEKEERLNLLRDKELEELIRTHDLIKEYNESNLSGKDRRKFLENKALKIGAFKKPHHPRDIRLGLHAAAVIRFNKRVEEARLSGAYNPRIKKDPRPALGLDSSEAPYVDAKLGYKRKKRSRGLSMGIGSYKSGVLVLKNSDLGALKS